MKGFKSWVHLALKTFLRNIGRKGLLETETKEQKERKKHHFNTGPCKILKASVGVLYLRLGGCHSRKYVCAMGRKRDEKSHKTTGIEMDLIVRVSTAEK